jgi:hypothetical protein
MNAVPASLSSKDVARTQEEIRGREPDPALRRDRLMQRARAARRRLARFPGDAQARLR